MLLEFEFKRLHFNFKPCGEQTYYQSQFTFIKLKELQLSSTLSRRVLRYLYIYISIFIYIDPLCRLADMRDKDTLKTSTEKLLSESESLLH